MTTTVLWLAISNLERIEIYEKWAKYYTCKRGNESPRPEGMRAMNK